MHYSQQSGFSLGSNASIVSAGLAGAASAVASVLGVVVLLECTEILWIRFGGQQ